MVDPEILVDHVRFVRGIALHLIRDEQVADDIAQETLLVALEKAPRNVVSLRSWLRKVALNVTRMRLRKDGRRQALEQRVALGENPFVDISPVETNEKEKVIRSVVDAVFSLDEPYRTTVVLRYYESLTPAEISARLGVPLETVRTRLRRALKRLRADLDHSYEGERQGWVISLLPLASGNPSGLSGITAAEEVSFRSAFPWIVSASALVLTTVLTASFFFFQGGGEEENLRQPMAPQEELHQKTTVADLDPQVFPAEEEEREVQSHLSPGSIRAHLTFSDGSPAVSVRGLFLQPMPGEEPTRPPGQDLVLVTDESGVMTWAEADPGDWFLYLDRCSEKFSVQVDSGKTSTVEISLPPGVRVEGLVVDWKRRVVSGADVLLATHSRLVDSGVVVASSAADGRFVIQDLSLSRYVGARAKDHEPSWMIAVSGKQTISTRSLVLVLPGPGASIQGRVFDPDLNPVPWAEVLLEDTRSLKRGSLKDGSYVMVPAVLRTRTDDLGRFHFPAVQRKEFELYVSQARFASVPLLVDVTGCESFSQDVILQYFSTLEGRVLSRQGVPVPDARLVIQDPGTGTFRKAPEAMTSSSGSFRVGGLVPGTSSIFVHGPSDSGQAEDQLDLLPGEVGNLEVHLSSGLDIQGQVVSEEGRLLSGFRVKAVAAFGAVAKWSPELRASREEVEVITGSDGRFLLSNRADCLHRLEVWEPAQPGGPPVMRVEGARPGQGEQQLRIPASSRLRSSIRGGLLLPTGEPAFGFRVGVVRERSLLDPWWVEPDLDGMFEISPLGMGQHLVLIEPVAPTGLPSLTPWTLASVDLLAGENLDLGRIRVSRPGALAARVTLRGENLLERPSLRVFDRWRQTSVDCQFDGEYATLAGLPPGSYQLCVFGFGAAARVGPSSTAFEIFEDETTELVVPVERALLCRVRFLEPGELRVARRLRVTLSDEQGSFLWTFLEGRTRSGKLQYRLDLQPGRYKIEAESDTGLFARGEIVIPEDFSDEMPFFFDLKKP